MALDLLPHIGDVEALRHTVFLQPISQIEALAAHGRLEDVEAAIKHDLPAGIGNDIAGMSSAGRIESPGELNPGADDRVRDAFQQFPLYLDLAFVGCGHQVDCDLIFRCLAPDDHLDKLHHVAHLIAQADIGIGDDNPAGAVNIRAEELFIADAFAVFGKDMMAFFQGGFLGRGWLGERGAILTLDDVGFFSRGFLVLWVLRRPPVIELREFLLLYRLHAPLLTIAAKVMEIDLRIGRIDAEQLILDPLTAFQSQLK